MASVTDWISSIGSLVGALTGVGALIVAVLSYRRSSSALAADAQTRGAVTSTLDAVEALGRTETAMPTAPDDHPSVGSAQYRKVRSHDEYASALHDARRQLEAL
ncbi:hypothetical protein NQ166_07175 [Microbacterium sp. zg.Y1090]|uniref:hypothetical protein n=1 Tax=Microbacterium TaxID=33882 RepID=UPI00214C34B1|nr:MULTISPECIES: hypothetical protein [unclassified Microbacterium]MCR2811941.1 hypothetical protein [Microbacterium sp. zg.Y1084]MCR2818620.1 hypothetical protein [Microbacterium sp. zg.Y1090]MDL5486433.1 hypothetical protein [Microbacterium sp. zg-Y1211]WIM29619.1 hypothetical protein QNO26_06985 [Microbacterium sp. zg-Y1090]